MMSLAHVTSRVTEEAESPIGPSRLPDEHPKAKYWTRTFCDVMSHKTLHCRSIVGLSMGAALGNPVWSKMTMVRLSLLTEC